MKYDCHYCTKRTARKKQMEKHENNDHSPRFNDDNTIHLSGGDQIVLLVKKMNGTWKKYHKSHTKNMHESFTIAGHKLENFEKDNGIRFNIKGDNVVGFSMTKLGEMKRNITGLVRELDMAKIDYMKVFEKKHSEVVTHLESIMLDHLTLPKWERDLMEGSW